MNQPPNTIASYLERSFFDPCLNSMYSHPHAWEIRYQYRNIHTAAGDNPLSIKVTNEHFFKDLSSYSMHWTVVADGEAMYTGTVDNINAAPGETTSLYLPLTRKQSKDIFDAGPEKDIFINVSWVLNERDGLLEAGT